jgi:hypothetical protein
MYEFESVTVLELTYTIKDAKNDLLAYCTVF